MSKLGSDLVLRCGTCGKQKDLQGATGWFPWADCSGERPWAYDREECDLKLRGLMRGASNVYFPATQSSLSIPPFSSRLHRLLESFQEAARGNWNEGTLQQFVEIIPGLRNRIKDGSFTIAEILAGFDDLYREVGVPRVKDDEWRVLTEPPTPSPGDDFRAHTLDISGSELADWFDSVTVVSLLREVMVLRGFTRIKSEGEIVEGPEPERRRLEVRLQTWGTAPPPIAQEGGVPGAGHWMPGVELFGEGIFFKFRPDKTSRWATTSAARVNQILSSPRRPHARAEIDLEDPRLLLVHSFSHLMIREISLTCGYSASSLRERLYVARDTGRPVSMCGALVYTSSTDSEGTLGGLIQQARDKGTLLEHVERMIDSSRICSQDPLCEGHDPVPTHDPWGASCHACTQLPETSCETLQNRMLDRLSIADPGSGYFT